MSVSVIERLKLATSDHNFNISDISSRPDNNLKRGHRARDHMVVRFITTYAISALDQLGYEFEFRSGEVYSIQHFVIKFVSDLR
jgi:hypothetical protein